MDDASFDTRKAAILKALADAAPDRSVKGFVDALCLPVIEFLTGTEDFVTTSSCSGRVALWQDGAGGDAEEAGEADAGADRKKSKGGGWLYVSHDLPNEQGLKTVLATPDDET
ncbi:tRNA wybutosine-synthesizing protein 3 [Diplonema papillatum]|nr:tRNA wybutosine-synthesizing protein 3 [Diplonema papillatum]